MCKSDRSIRSTYCPAELPCVTNMKNTLLVILLLASATFAQHSFELKSVSKYFDVKIEMEDPCDEYACEGPAKFSFYKKNGAKPYQVIELGNTYVSFDGKGKPLVNVTQLYDEQGVVNVGDYNFDGMEDIALRNGNEGSYGGPSYSIYLSNRAKGQFVHNDAFSELASHLGMFKIDTKAKTIETFDKSGCCWHITERYKVVGSKPVKIYEMVEDGTKINEKTGENMREVTIKRLVNGKWRKTVRREK